MSRVVRTTYARFGEERLFGFFTASHRLHWDPLRPRSQVNSKSIPLLRRSWIAHRKVDPEKPKRSQASARVNDSPSSARRKLGMGVASDTEEP